MFAMRKQIEVLGQVLGFYLIHFIFFGRHFIEASVI
jgi:hypothetical protein